MTADSSASYNIAGGHRPPLQSDNLSRRIRVQRGCLPFFHNARWRQLPDSFTDKGQGNGTPYALKIDMRAATADLETHVHIASGSVSLGAMLAVPQNATSIVVFAHGSGSSRFSPRNIFVAEVLRAHGLGFLLMDLLSATEDLSTAKRFNTL